VSCLWGHDVGTGPRFNQCINAAGLHVWLEYTDNARDFVFAAKDTPDGGGPPTITGFEPSNVRCETPPKGQQLGPGNTFRTKCYRPNANSLRLIVRATRDPKEGGTLVLPAIKPPELLVEATVDGTNCAAAVAGGCGANGPIQATLQPGTKARYVIEFNTPFGAKPNIRVIPESSEKLIASVSVVEGGVRFSVDIRRDASDNNEYVPSRFRVIAVGPPAK
jgi:hypothetical protein